MYHQLTLLITCIPISVVSRMSRAKIVVNYNRDLIKHVLNHADKDKRRAIEIRSICKKQN